MMSYEIDYQGLPETVPQDILAALRGKEDMTVNIDGLIPFSSLPNIERITPEGYHDLPDIRTAF